MRAIQAFVFNFLHYKKIFEIKENDFIAIRKWKPRFYNQGKHTDFVVKINKIVWVDWFTSPWIELDTKPESFVRLEDLAQFVIYSK